MAKEYFLAYHSYLETFRSLSDAEIGRLFMAALEYSAEGKLAELKGNERFAFAFVKQQIDRDTERYEKKCETSKENGKLGGRPKKENLKNQTVFSKTQKRQEKDKGKGEGECKEEVKEKTSKKEKTALFEKFWSVYPKKVAKQAAFKAFRKIPKIEATLGEILAGVEKWEHSEQWQNPQFIPYPAKFLNDKRWEDKIQKGGENYESNRQHSDRKICTEYPE